MKASKGYAIALVATIVIIAAATMGISSTSGVGLWFIQGTFDRMNPFVDQVTVYARTPAPDAYFDSYADATGNGENYVYKVRAYDGNGIEYEANLISFGVKLGAGSDDAPQTHLKLSIRGSHVRRWEWIAADAVPAVAAKALE